MTRDEALALIPPGWVECRAEHSVQLPCAWKMAGYDDDGRRWDIYAIPAPKPEPRRVPCGEMVVLFDEHGWPHPSGFWTGPAGTSFEDTKWKFDHEAREWVEVLDEA